MTAALYNGMAALYDANLETKTLYAFDAMVNGAPAIFNIHKFYMDLVTRLAYQFCKDSLEAIRDASKSAIAAVDSVNKDQAQAKWDLDVSDIQTYMEKVKSMLTYLSQNEVDTQKVGAMVKELSDLTSSILRKGF